jgi:hypothetical protein
MTWNRSDSSYWCRSTSFRSPCCVFLFTISFSFKWREKKGEKKSICTENITFSSVSFTFFLLFVFPCILNNLLLPWTRRGKGRSIEQQLIRWIGKSLYVLSQFWVSLCYAPIVIKWMTSSEFREPTGFSLFYLFFDSVSLSLLSVCRLVTDKSPAAIQGYVWQSHHVVHGDAKRIANVVSKSIDLHTTHCRRLSIRLDSNFSDGSWAIGSSKLINSEIGRAYTERSTWGRGKQE